MSRSSLKRVLQGGIEQINLQFANLNSLEARGVDYEIGYSFDLMDVFSAARGNVDIRIMATNYIDNITDNNVTAINFAGMNTTDTPDWVYRATARYTLDTWMFNLTLRGISDGVVNNEYIECVSDCPVSEAPNFTINDNAVPGRTYLDAYISKNFFVRGVEGELFLSIKNLFDTDPVLVRDPRVQGRISEPGFPPTNRMLYDFMGRNFRMGFRVQV